MFNVKTNNTGVSSNHAEEVFRFGQYICRCIWFVIKWYIHTVRWNNHIIIFYWIIYLTEKNQIIQFYIMRLTLTIKDYKVKRTTGESSQCFISIYLATKREQSVNIFSCAHLLSPPRLLLEQLLNKKEENISSKFRSDSCCKLLGGFLWSSHSHPKALSLWHSFSTNNLYFNDRFLFQSFSFLSFSFLSLFSVSF